MPPKQSAQGSKSAGKAKAITKPRGSTSAVGSKGQNGANQASTSARARAGDSDDDEIDEAALLSDDDLTFNATSTSSRRAEEARGRGVAPPKVNEEDDNDDDDDDDDRPERNIPPALLTRILHESFQHKEGDGGGRGTRITKDANGAVAKYMDVFVREAIARAVAERKGGFLEVEDLEKIAPQLLLDL